MTPTASQELHRPLDPPDIRWETVPCNYCGRDDTRIYHRERLLYFGRPLVFTIVRCRRCGLVYTNPRLTEHNATYLLDASQDPAAIEAHGRAKRPVYAGALNEIEALGKGPNDGRARTLLDVGCGTGHFLEAARRRGFEVAGIEPAPASAKYAVEQFHVPVYETDVFTIDLPAERYDVITAWDVIEHVSDPRRFLQRISRWLKPRGILALRFPSAPWQKIKGVILHQILNSSWPSFGATMHLYFFSETTIAGMMQTAGMDMVRAKTTLAEANSQNAYINRMKKASQAALRGIEYCSGKKLGNLEVYGRKRPQDGESTAQGEGAA